MMSHITPNNSSQSSGYLKTLIVILLVIGIVLRFTHLPQKVYWHDEAFTSLAVSGHTLAELKQEISNTDGVIPVTKSITLLNQYQKITPGRGLADTIRYLSTSDPQHPPLYYVLARGWAQVFGDSPASIRSLSAWISLLVFPGIYWLCIELFGVPTIAWVSVGIAAISPFELFFAQEARQYGLWIVMILISSAALLTSIRRENCAGTWAAYAIALTLGLYTHLFMALVAVAHGTYVTLSQRFRWSDIMRGYCLSTAIAILIFSPWLFVFRNHLQTALELTSWAQIKLISSPAILIAILLTRASRIFFDIDAATDSAWVDSLSSESSISYAIVAIVACLILATYLTYFLYSKRELLSHYLFVVVLGTIPTLLLLSSDVALGGIRAIYFRYQLPLYISLQISVACVLGSNLTHQQGWKHKFWQMLLVGVISASLFSDTKLLSANSWWLQINGRSTIEISALLNRIESPVLLVNTETSNIGAILTLSQRLKPDVLVAPVREDSLLITLSELESRFKNIFFFDFNSTLRMQLKDNDTYTTQLIEPTVEFRRLKRK